MKNVSDALERVLHRHRSELSAALHEQSPSPQAPAPQPSAPGPASPLSPIAEARRAAGQAFYDQVHALRAEGASIGSIARRTGRDPNTVQKYLRSAQCPTRAPRRTKTGTLTVFDTHLRTWWREGCHDAKALWQELVPLGFRGTVRTVQRHVAAWPTAHPRRGHRVALGGRIDAVPLAKPPSPRQARWWLVSPPERLTTEQAEYVGRLSARCPVVAAARELATEFGRLLRAHDLGAFDRWLRGAAACELAEFRELSASLQRDLAAVTEAIRGPWSNGQTEGQVNKLKALKRQMYGRASVSLLRQRMLHAA